MSRAGNVLRILLSSQGVPYYPELSKALGSIAASIFLQEICHWQGYSEDGWAFRTQEEIQEATALRIDAQNGARKILRSMGLLEEKRRGIPARMYYRVNTDKLADILEQHDQGEPPPQKREVPEQESRSVQEQDTPPAQNSTPGNPGTIYTGKYAGKDSPLSDSTNPTKVKKDKKGKLTVRGMTDEEAAELIAQINESLPADICIEIDKMIRSVAGSNKTNEMKMTRAWREFWGVFKTYYDEDSLSNDAWLYALREANARGKVSMRYVIAVARNYTPNNVVPLRNPASDESLKAKNNKRKEEWYLSATMAPWKVVEHALQTCETHDEVMAILEDNRQWNV